MFHWLFYHYSVLKEISYVDNCGIFDKPMVEYLKMFINKPSMKIKR